MAEHTFARDAAARCYGAVMSDDTTGESTELLQTLIRSACVNDGGADSGHEARNTDVLRAYLEGPGVELQEYESRPGRTSLVARLEGTDPAAPTICLMGHTDVVPVNPDGWSRDPFGGELVDGEIWGRGALDMLYQTATQAVAFRHLVRSGMRPRGTLVYFAVPDEEAGGTWGAKWMIDHHWDAIACDYLLTEMAGVVMPTPSGPRVTVTVAEKGIAWRRLRVRGTPGHGSMPYGADNAVVTTAEIIRRIEARRPPAGLGDVWRETVAAYGFDDELEARLLDPSQVLDALADISDRDTATVLHACSHTTISPNIVRGGVKSNVIPDTVELELDIRTLPGVTADEVDAELRDLIGDLADRVEIGRLQDSESTASPTGNEMWQALARRVASAHPGSTLLPQLEIGATDARFFRSKGTIAYGTGLFSSGLSYEDMVSRFHGNDERIDVDSLRLTTDLWLGVAHDLLA
jgi:acetylornithine deacetylase/succinyl-diaminopimelate desuccinylase-like protein